MFKELKKTMFEEMKEGMMIMSNSIENISIKTEMIKNNQMDIMKLKSTITKIKSSLECLNSWFELAEERINKLGRQINRDATWREREKRKTDRVSEKHGTPLSTTTDVICNTDNIRRGTTVREYRVFVCDGS